MTIVWHFHHNDSIWLEWIDKGKTTLNKFTEEEYTAFMSINKKDITLVEDQDLDFLN